MRRLSVLFVVIVGAACALPSSALAAEYTTFVACSVTGDLVPTGTCPFGSTPAAFFEADEDTEYEVCVEFPSREYLCSELEEAEENVLYVNEITTDLPGVHFVEWFVDDTEVGFDLFDLLAPVPPVVPPAIPPAAAPPGIVAPTPSRPSPACKRAKSKVQRLKTKLGNAKGKEAKGKIRPQLKAAKADAKKRC